MQSSLSPNHALFEFALFMGDNGLICGHRLSEWTGHGPALEQDIAITNISLDLIGQATSWLNLAGEVEGKGRSADDLAYFRSDRQYRNFLLTEQPNGDWAMTIVRQFLFDCFHFEMLQALLNSQDERVVAIAAKSIKEVVYHLRYNSEWMIRLGDGTVESHRRMQRALKEQWRFLGELYEDQELDQVLAESGISVLPSSLKQAAFSRMRGVLKEATLKEPAAVTDFKGSGRKGIHSEHLGHLLAVMQSVQRAYPGQEW
ncbi:MAG: phenylacetate-CoA oxygenase subunit PaaC [Saprospiraceae bacterium]|nr:phenylacetate-CoA oxygenase subunit PaaC [Saprospiraceae bacterium]